MEVFKTYLFFEGYDENHSYLIDTIQYEGQWWLVGSWFQSHLTDDRVPERLVRLSGLRYQEVQGQPYRFFLNNALPKALLDGQEQPGYVITLYPAVLRTQGPESIQ